MNYRRRRRVRVAPPLWPISVVVVALYVALLVGLFVYTRVPSNKEASAELQKEFAGANRVLFRTGTLYDRNFEDERTLKVIEDPKEIAEFARGIEVIPSGMECLCDGQFTMELLRDGQVSNRISLQHGSTLRVQSTGWRGFSGDLFLMSASILHIYRWFGSHGVRHPDEYPRQEFAQSAALAQMTAGGEALFPEELWAAVFNIYTEGNWKQTIERLWPEQTERAATMLRLLGTYSFSWDICLGSRLERLVRDILPSLSPQPVFAAMERYQNDSLLESGAAHWFIGYGKLEGIDREVATRLLGRLASSALVHPRPHNRFLTRRVLARLGSPQAMLLLRSFADGKLPSPPPLPWYEADMEICATDARRPVEEDESLPEREHALKLLRRETTNSRAGR